MMKFPSISLFGAVALLPAVALADPPPPATLPSPCATTDDTITGNWGGARDALAAEHGIAFCVQEQSELFGNLSGGLRRGATYDGLTVASVKVDNFAGLDGLSFYASGLQIHGRGPTPNLVGNLQTISGAEATRSTKLYDLWIEQSLFGGALTVRIGQEAANDEFMLMKSAAYFVNSSFGFPASMALSLPSGGPNYPLATPMVRVQYTANDRFTVLAAVFDGDPAGRGSGDPQLRDRSGTAFRMRDDAFGIAEFWYSVGSAEEDGRPGVYKIGGWYHSGLFDDPAVDNAGRPLASPGSTGIPRRLRGNQAFYVNMDQTIWRPAHDKDRGVNLFALAIAMPDDRNLSSFFVQGGLSWVGPFAGRAKDVLGLAFAFTNLGAAERAYGADLVRFGQAAAPFRGGEIVLELTYQYALMPGVTLQPDLQYVIGPGAGTPNATSGPIKNAVVAGGRVTLMF